MHDLFGKDTIELVMACLNVEELKESLTKERQDYIDEKTEIEKNWKNYQILRNLQKS